MIRTHSQIINLWPSLGELASDVDQDREVVRLWQKRNRIPNRHWASIAAAARKRRLGVTVEELAMGMLKVNNS